jgi:hypothetical protein
MQDSFI